MNIISGLPGSSPVKSRDFIQGVDSIRFVAAIWVAFFHGARPSIESASNSDPIFWKIAAGVNSHLFSGTGAVIVFFVVSGLCIHFPNAGKSSLNWRQFLLRRISRIGIPLAAIIVLVQICGENYVRSLDAVLWSIYCEVIYYTIYPILFIILKYSGTKLVLTSSALLSIALFVCYPHYDFLFDYGLFLTWVFCLPAWLSGVLLAENVRKGSLRRFGSLWAWRVGVIVCGMLNTRYLHMPHPWLGVNAANMLLAPVGYLWVSQEIQAYKPTRIRVIFERLGIASYTIYLIHKVAITAFEPYKDQHPVMAWMGILTALLAFTLMFYFSVERPSHRFAKSIKISVAGRLGPSLK